jgi:hypothetical protein
LLFKHGETCPYCNKIIKINFNNKNAHNEKNFPTRDHVIPKSVMPGQPRIIVCRECNQNKDKKTLLEWYHKLKNNNDIRKDIIKEHLKRSGYKKEDIENE